jgi:hypothetical protein
MRRMKKYARLWASDKAEAKKYWMQITKTLFCFGNKTTFFSFELEEDVCRKIYRKTDNNIDEMINCLK